MKKIKLIKELLASSERLTQIDRRARARSRVLDHVRASLPDRLARAVVSAGVDQGRLTIGVSGPAWAARIRYLADATRQAVSVETGVELSTVRVRVVQARPAAAT